MNRCYKLVWNNNGQLSSCCQSWDFPEEIRIYYTPGVKAVPFLRNSKLFVFAKLDKAIEFSKTFYQTLIEVWLCDCDELIPIKEIPRPAQNYIFAFWDGKLVKDKHYYITYQEEIDGTFITNHVTLLEKVGSNDVYCL